MYLYKDIRSIIKNECEKEIKNGKGCIIFDIGIYFPFAYSEDCSFTFSVNEWDLLSDYIINDKNPTMEAFTDLKLNHRYPNRNYYTFTKKYGRKLSKIGYPFFLNFDECDKPFYLCIGIGNVKVHFPIKINITKDKPICELSLYINLSDGIKWDFSFSSKNSLFGPTCKREWIANKDTSRWIFDNNHIMFYNLTLEPCEQEFDKFIE